MGSLVSDLTVRMSADAGNLMSGVGSASGSLQGLLGTIGRMNPVVAIFAGIGTAAIGFGAASVKAAGDFQQGITTLSTGAGEAQKNLQMVGDGILSLATSTGTSTKQLTDGMYMIESAGYHGKTGLDVLKNAAEGAKVGNADLGTVSDATTTIMTDFSSKNVTASQAVNTLIATVSNGKTTMQALSGSLAQILPTASAAGISLTDTSAAMATMTGEGIPAANAATFLRQTIVGLEAPSKQTVTGLAGIGLTSKQVSDEMKVSLPGALELITDHLKKKFPEGSAEYVNALKNISGGSKTMQGMLDLTGAHLATFKGNVVSISGSVKQGGDSINGWTQVQQEFNFKLAQGKEILETFSIKVGQALLPVLSGVMDKLLPLAGGFSQLFTASSPLAPIIANIAGMFRIMGFNWSTLGTQSGPAVQAFQQFGQLLGQQLPGFISIFLIGLNSVNSVLVSVAGAVMSWVAPALQILGQIIKGVQGYWLQIVTVVDAQLLPALQNLIAAVAPVVKAFLQWIATSGIIPKVFQGLGVVMTYVITVISTLINVIATIITWLSHCSVVVAVVQFAFQFLATVIITSVNIIISIVNLLISLPQRIQQTWTAIQVWWNSLWTGVQQTTTNTGTSISSFISNLWTGILNTAISFGQGFLAAITAPFRLVGDLFVWLYQHNYYFQALVDTVMNLTRQVGAFLQSAWSAAVNFVVGLWNGAVGFARGAWSSVSGAISNAVNIARNAIIVGFNAAATFLSGIWANIVSAVTGVWQNISSIFSSAWGTYVAAPLNGLKSNITGFFSGLASMALTWGQNLIQGFIDGINNMAGGAGQAATNVVNNVKSMLGFHSPSKEGPGRDADTWAPNLMAMFVSGISGAIPQVRTATMAVADQLSSMNGLANYQYTGRSSAMAMMAAGSGGGSNTGEQHIHVHIGNDEIAEYVTDKQMKMARLGGYRR